MTLTLAEMRPNQSGMVVEIEVGGGKAAQLAAMGLRPGMAVTKQHGQPLRGPVTFRVGKTQLAVGWGIARRILVEVAE